MTDMAENSIQAPMTTEDQREMILNILVDMMPDQVVPYLDHVGFDIAGLNDANQLPAAWLGHYRLGQGTCDVDRALMDLATWPPISRRIFELQAEQRRLAT